MLIINADDFGKDSVANKAVIESFKRGFCSSATIMPNMPGFEEACELAHNNKLINHIGIHLVLTGGPPITDKIKRFPNFCNHKNQLCLLRNKRTFFYLTNPEKNVLAEEIRAQIKRCRKYGIIITHLDSHFHIHTEWAIVNILIPIVREERITYMRLSRNCNVDSFYKRIYKNIFNYRLRKSSLNRTEYFGSINDYTCFKKLMGSSKIIKSFEIMIHPYYDAQKNLIDLACADNRADIDNKELEISLAQVDGYREAVSFKGTVYGNKSCSLN